MILTTCRGARRDGEAGSGKTGQRQNSSPKRQQSLVPSTPRHRRQVALTSLQKQELAKSYVNVVRLANVVVVYVDGVELVAVQDEGFARALCLNSEEVREEVGRVEVRGCGLFGCGLFGLLFVIRDRGKVRNLKLVVEGEVRGRVGRVEGRSRSSDRSSRWNIGLKIQTSG